MIKNQAHLLLTTKGQEEVPELLEGEEEEEMDPVVPVGMKVQTGMEVKILRKKMIVVLPLRE